MGNKIVIKGGKTRIIPQSAQELAQQQEIEARWLAEVQEQAAKEQTIAEAKVALKTATKATDIRDALITILGIE